MTSKLERRMLAIEQQRVVRLNAASLSDQELSEMISPVFKGRAITEGELYAIRGLPNDQKRTLTAKEHAMAELLLKMLERAGQAIHNPFAMGRDYVRPQPGEITKDFHRVARDMKAVGGDLKTTVQRELQRYGK